jgi:hypothetical protein
VASFDTLDHGHLRQLLRQRAGVVNHDAAAGVRVHDDVGAVPESRPYHSPSATDTILDIDLGKYKSVACLSPAFGGMMPIRLARRLSLV